MDIPKRIDKLLSKRCKLAEDLNSVSIEIDKWLENHNANLSSDLVSDAVLSGCMIYTEPSTAETMVREYIKNEL